MRFDTQKHTKTDKIGQKKRNKKALKPLYFKAFRTFEPLGTRTRDNLIKSQLSICGNALFSRLFELSFDTFSTVSHKILSINTGFNSHDASNAIIKFSFIVRSPVSLRFHITGDLKSVSFPLIRPSIQKPCPRPFRKPLSKIRFQFATMVPLDGRE